MLVCVFDLSRERTVWDLEKGAVLCSLSDLLKGKYMHAEVVVDVDTRGRVKLDSGWLIIPG